MNELENITICYVKTLDKSPWISLNSTCQKIYFQNFPKFWYPISYQWIIYWNMFRPLNYTYNVLVSALINLINSFFLSLYLLEKMNDFYVIKPWKRDNQDLISLMHLCQLIILIYCVSDYQFFEYSQENKITKIKLIGT